MIHDICQDRKRKQMEQMDKRAVHGGNKEAFCRQYGIRQEECLDFSANMNPLGTPDCIKRAMEEALFYAAQYPDPDCKRLCTAIGRKYDIPAEWVLCGNGAADLIFRICYGLRPVKVLLTAPSFMEYMEALSAAGAKMVSYFLKEDMELSEDFLEWITPEISMVFLCIPNNPTGLMPEKELVKKIIGRCRDFGITLVLDVCFYDFTGEAEYYTDQKKSGEMDHVIFLHSFTKMFAIPGIRLGYLVCADLLKLEQIKNAGQTWSVSTPAMAAGLAALCEDDFVKRTTEYVRSEREFLKQGLEKTGMRVYDGKADYLFFYAGQKTDLYEALAGHKIMIRDCSDYIGLQKGYYRTAVRTHAENERLLEAVNAVIKTGGIR